MTAHPSPFGRLLRQHREAAGLGVNELARRVHLSGPGIGDVERGKRITLGREHWPALCAALPTLTEAALEEAQRDSFEFTCRPNSLPGAGQRLLANALVKLLAAAPQLPDEQAARAAIAVGRLQRRTVGGRKRSC